MQTNPSDTCSTFWLRVFKAKFGDTPTGNDDERWDELLHTDNALRGHIDFRRKVLETLPSFINIPRCKGG